MGLSMGQVTLADKMRTGKLTALAVKNLIKAREPGLKNDGGGLYLKNGSSWIFRYSRDGRKHDQGLGPAFVISLAEARQKAAEARRLLLDGQDPIKARRASRAGARKTKSLAEVAAAHIEAQRPGWRSEKHSR
jgi:Arm DNA-binding domain